MPFNILILKLRTIGVPNSVEVQALANIKTKCIFSLDRSLGQTDEVDTLPEEVCKRW